MNKDYLYQKARGPLPFTMTNDYLFKALMQKNKRVLKSLSCSLLHINPNSVRSITITNPIPLGESIDEKVIYLDVNLILSNKILLNLEMQAIDKRNWKERSIFYASRNYASLEKPKDYKKVKKTIQIGLLDYTLFPDNPSFYSTYRLMDTKTHYLYSDKYSIGVVDLQNIDLATAEDKRYNIDKWARLFKATSWEEILMLAESNTVIDDAAETIYSLSNDERIRLQCQAREDYERTVGAAYREVRSLKAKVTRKEKTIALQANVIAEQADQLASKDSQLASKDSQLASKESQLAQKESQLAQKDDEIARLKARLAEKET